MLIQIKLWYHLYIKLHACAVLLVETPDMIFLILLHLKNPRIDLEVKLMKEVIKT